MKGDLYDLACLILKVYDSKNKGTNTISCHTINGLTKEFALLARIDLVKVRAIVERHVMPLRVTNRIRRRYRVRI